MTGPLLGVALATVILAGAVAIAARYVAARLELVLEHRTDHGLEGRLVIVNKPEPDGSSIRGVVREEYPDGGLLLGAAVYLERPDRSPRARADVVEIPAGDAYVPTDQVGWVQLNVTAPAPE